ncbi:STAS-like domain-containing protein [Phenylobacterium sp.]|uniref:STAS-like domain-containing protein n=1 Tax=Phenylobacterium sp. TaxID=1871053 RepID=UPI0028124E94|nr:STAS-like domain-containing protein [Phenylobacterium sp.]
MSKVIRLASDFTRFPFGRYRSQGGFSGEAFRDDVLLPLLRNGERIVVDLDGTSGLSPSFLEEAFGGLVRAGFSPDEVIERVQISSDEDPSYIDEVRGYVREAAAAAA